MKFEKKVKVGVFLTLMTLCLGVYGCKEEAGIVFSHRLHVVENEVECSVCHGESPDESGHFRLPDMDTCSECHEINLDEPSQECLTCHRGYRDPDLIEVKKAEKPPIRETISFTHEPHLDMDLKCNECHYRVRKSKSIKDDLIPAMKKCVFCHRKEGGPLQCNACHLSLPEKALPLNHRGNWRNIHGRYASSGFDCNMCHRKSFCIDCHRLKRPPSHTVTWKSAAHGVAANMDRSKCTVCHQADFCSRCHSTKYPKSHFLEGWAEGGKHADLARRNLRACYTCHGDGELCNQCHPNPW